MASDTPNEQVIVQLPTAELTPLTLLHQLLEDVDDLKIVYVVVKKKDETFHASWTNSPVGDMLIATTLLEHKTKGALLYGENVVSS